MNTSETHVLKFGGSSLRDPDCIRTSVRTVAARAREARVRVVVSAMQGVTDELFSLAEEIDNGNGNAAGRIKKLRKSTCRFLTNLVAKKNRNERNCRIYLMSSANFYQKPTGSLLISVCCKTVSCRQANELRH